MTKKKKTIIIVLSIIVVLLGATLALAHDQGWLEKITNIFASGSSGKIIVNVTYSGKAPVEGDSVQLQGKGRLAWSYWNKQINSEGKAIFEGMDYGEYEVLPLCVLGLEDLDDRDWSAPTISLFNSQVTENVDVPCQPGDDGDGGL